MWANDHFSVIFKTMTLFRSFQTESLLTLSGLNVRANVAGGLKKYTMSRRLEAICVAYESLRSVGVLMVYM